MATGTQMNDDVGWLGPAWTQRGLNALRDTLDVDAAAKRDMIEFLFEVGLWDAEHLGWAAANARFNACLNPGKSDFFKLSEVWALMKRFRRTQFLAAMADDLGFELRPRTTEARRQELLERLAEVQERHYVALEACTAELVRLGLAEDALRVHPAVRERGPKF